MRAYALAHLSDTVLLRALDDLVVRDRGTTADLVAHIAEVDARALYAPAYASMHAYCLGRLHLSEDAAYKRIQAARTARTFPALFDELAEGRLNLSSVCLIAPHLSSANVDELVRMARHASNAEIRQRLESRFAETQPKPAPPPPARQIEAPLRQLAAQQVERRAGAPVEAPVAAREAIVLDPGPTSYLMQFTITAEDRERLRYAQALSSHAVPSGDVAEIYRRAIEALIAKCERRRFGATSRRQGKRTPVRGRQVPAAVRRVVWRRDGGRCTFVAPSGHRCAARSFLEFDHVVPVARGGLATGENLRLRCRAHNQVAADRVFGARFMREKRRQAHARDAGRGSRSGSPRHGAPRHASPRSPPSGG
jgi:5-methylcytosine-specific restriction endonuclease McrA